MSQTPASFAEKDATAVTFTVADGWPTPNHCRRIAAALDAITPARYGDILRAYADAEDARFKQHGPIGAIRRTRPIPPGQGTTD